MRTFITTTLMLLISVLVSGQDFQATVSSDSVLLGNYIEVSFIAENMDGEFEAPEFEDMKIVSGPNTSSSIQIINGDRSSKITYSYYVEPMEVGTYSIPPAYYVDGDETRETLPITINVYPNPENIMTSPPSTSQDFFFQFGDMSPFGNQRTPQSPKPPTPPTKPKRKYKKI